MTIQKNTMKLPNPANAIAMQTIESSAVENGSSRKAVATRMVAGLYATTGFSRWIRLTM